jgi:hypothetical protein
MHPNDEYGYWDFRLHSIRDGDDECIVCGNPSDTIYKGNVYCKKHDPIRQSQINGDTAKGEQNGREIHQSKE